MATCCFKKGSVIRGHHVYKRVWTPVFGEILSATRKEDNSFDKHAVAILKDGLIVGHLPKEFSRVSSYFLLQEGQMEAHVNGKKDNWKGLEVPFVYIFTAKKKRIDRIKQLLNSD
uniref:HIRAN domain-containing protein n=1 Tax=Amphimedon queenslandica TaxID=400682 RepID=A0A1X7VJY3_AMPQE